MNFIIQLQIYSIEILVSVAEKNNVLKRVMDRQKIDYGDYFERELELGRCTLLKLKKGAGYIVVMRFRSDPSHGTIAHEVFHSASFVLDLVGIKLDIDKNDEAYAYLIGFITDKIYEGIYERN